LQKLTFHLKSLTLLKKRKQNEIKGDRKKKKEMKEGRNKEKQERNKKFKFA
jgi:hypothetical protein